MQNIHGENNLNQAIKHFKISKFSGLDDALFPGDAKAVEKYLPPETKAIRESITLQTNVCEDSQSSRS